MKVCLYIEKRSFKETILYVNLPMLIEQSNFKLLSVNFEINQKSILFKLTMMNNQLLLYQDAKRLYEAASQNQARISQKDQKWFQRLMSSGTLQDRVSALTIKIKDNPLMSLEPLQQLLQITDTNSRQESLKTLFTIKDIFINLLLNQYSFKTFQENLQANNNPTEDELIEFYFSHNLKRFFSDLLKIIEKKSSDPLSYIRRQSLVMIIDLYGSQLEGTKQLLSLLINKLGDSDKQLIANLTKQLSTLLSKTPALTYNVLKELQNFIYRPNLKQEAQLYAVNLISSINLKNQVTSEQRSLEYILKMMINIFKKLLSLSEPEQECSKFLAHVLRCLNKSIPFAQKDSQMLQQIYQEHEKSIFTLVARSESFKIKIQTLFFIYQIQNGQYSDRYYRSLYDILLQSDLPHSSLLELFFDLLFLSIKSDGVLNRQMAFVKRLLQVAIHANAAFTITSLIFVSKLMDQIPGIKTSVTQKQTFFQDDDEEVFKDADDSNQQETKAQEAQKKNEVPAYDPFKREPKFANANLINLWELHALLNHYHPKVREFASLLIEKQCVLKTSSNPLIEFQLSTFLSNFVEKQTRKTKQLQTQQLSLANIEQQESGDLTNRYMFKFLKRKFRENEEKIGALGKKQKKKKGDEMEDQEIDEEEADDFADELFEKQLTNNQNNGNKYDVDDDDDQIFEEDEDDQDFEEDDDNSETDEQQDFRKKKNVKKIGIGKKIQKKRSLLKK